MPIYDAGLCYALITFIGIVIIVLVSMWMEYQISDVAVAIIVWIIGSVWITHHLVWSLNNFQSINKTYNLVYDPQLSSDINLSLKKDLMAFGVKHHYYLAGGKCDQEHVVYPEEKQFIIYKAFEKADRYSVLQCMDIKDGKLRVFVSDK